MLSAYAKTKALKLLISECIALISEEDLQISYRYMILESLEMGIYDIISLVINIVLIATLWRMPLYLNIILSGEYITEIYKNSYFYAKHKLVCRSIFGISVGINQMLNDLPYILLLPLNMLAFWRGIEWVRYSFMKGGCKTYEQL